jgi:hypothetical protein
MLETGYSLGLWSLIQDQVRVAGFGQPYALDLAAVSNIFAALGVQDIELQLKKVNAIFKEIYSTGKK